MELQVMADSLLITRIQSFQQKKFQFMVLRLSKDHQMAHCPKLKKYNRIFALIRAVIENVIDPLKKWRIIKGVYRHFSVTTHNQIDFNLVIRVLVKLTTAKLQRQPLRPPTFKLPIARIF
jgi:hypothetical protein